MEGLLQKFVGKDNIARIFPNGVTPDNVNEQFRCKQFRDNPQTLLSVVTRLKKGNESVDRIRCLLNMGAKVYHHLLMRVSSRIQLRAILHFGVDQDELDSALSWHTQLYAFGLGCRDARKDYIMYGARIPVNLFPDEKSLTKSPVYIFNQNVERRIENCRRALLTLILCIQQTYKPLKSLIRQFAKWIWLLQPYCNDLVTPSAGPRSEAWDDKNMGVADNPEKPPAKKRRRKKSQFY